MRVENCAITMMSNVNPAKKSKGKDFLSFLTSNYSSSFTSNTFQFGQARNAASSDMELPTAVKAVSAQAKTIASSIKGVDFIEVEVSRVDRRKMIMTQQLLQALTGKKVKFHLVKATQQTADFVNLIMSNRKDAHGGDANSPGIGLEYSDVQYERQEMSFTSDGTLTTEDGRKIDFSVELNLSKEFINENNISIDADQRLVDPLVINFDNSTTGLTNTKFSFDIDANGSPEQVSFVTKGSGLLAVDLNDDGKINNGIELFGPKTGDGFADLSSYDADGNNWIDENDPIYDKLRIWTKDPDGKDNLFALGAKGIGAIYLGNVSTDYNISDSPDDVQGVLKKTGIFVKEDGTVGTVQDVDLTA